MLINVPKVINKTIADVKKKMGEPDSIFNYAGADGGMAEIYRYNRNVIDIYFYNGIAKEILIGDPKPVKFDFYFIKYLGIYPDIAPDYMHDSVVISWGNLPEYDEIKIFTENIDYEEGTWDYKIFVNAK